MSRRSNRSRLIRDIAGQTNLLASTRPSRRHGPATPAAVRGRRQEVKSLASQTARATDDITTKIAAIQSATRQTVSANDSIQARSEGGADQRRPHPRAMEMQAQTVDDDHRGGRRNAFGGRFDVLDDLRDPRRHENVASEIDEVEKNFGEIDEPMARFKASAGRFVQNFAA